MYVTYYIILVQLYIG